MYELPKILFIFSRMVYLHLHQGEHLKYTLENICPVGQKKMKYFTVTLDTLTESLQVFFKPRSDFLKQDQTLQNIIDHLSYSLLTFL